MDRMLEEVRMLRRREWLAAVSAALLAGLAVVTAAWDDAEVVEVRVQGRVPMPAPSVSATTSPPTTSPRATARWGRVVWAADGDVWLHDERTGEHRALTHDGAAQEDFLPRFRDTDRVTFIRSDDRDAEPTLVELDLGTGRSSTLTRLRGGVRAYDWSPDGETLAYYRAASDNDPTVLHIVGPGAAIERPFRPIPGRGGFVNWDEARVEWSPSGRQLLMLDTALDTAVDTSQANTLYVLNADDGTDAIRPRVGTWARWSADGRTVYCLCLPPASLSEDCVWQAVDVTTGATTVLPVLAAARPSVSPDGRMLAFDDGEDIPSVHVLDLDDAGSRPRLVARAAIAPVWLNARRLAVTDTRPCPSSRADCEAGGHGSMFHPAGTASAVDVRTGHRSPLPPLSSDGADADPGGWTSPRDGTRAMFGPEPKTR